MVSMIIFFQYLPLIHFGFSLLLNPSLSWTKFLLLMNVIFPFCISTNRTLASSLSLWLPPFRCPCSIWPYFGIHLAIWQCHSSFNSVPSTYDHAYSQICIQFICSAFNCCFPLTGYACTTFSCTICSPFIYRGCSWSRPTCHSKAVNSDSSIEVCCPDNYFFDCYLAKQ